MTVLNRLDASAVRRWSAVGLGVLSRHKDELNDLNVYPVPDGDTGTNLLLTMESVQQALAKAAADGDLATTMRTVAHGALMGARGNSGVILSQLLRGMAEVLGPLPDAGAADLQRALERAADLAYAAVAQPVEGTVLTVARAAAAAARQADGHDLPGVVRAAAHGAAEALARTPTQLAALARAGVVDAGGRGLCLLLEALVSVVTGEAVAGSAPPPVVPRDRGALAVAREAGSPDFGYEVQYLLDADADAVERLKADLAPLGDSLVVVGGEGLWNVHVHVNDVGAAVEAGISAGRPHRVTVTRFDDQISADGSGGDALAGVPGTPAEPGTVARAVVAVAQGDGLVELFRRAGARVVRGGPGTSPSTGELADAITATGAREVVVLPNDGNVHGAAAQAAAASGADRTVHVIPSRSPVQGLAALAVHDPARDFGDDAIQMTTAAAATRWAEVTVAVREAQTMAGRCRPGDVLGLIEGDVVVIGSQLAAVTVEVAERLLASGGDLVTIVTGADCPAGLGEELAGRLGAGHPGLEVEAHAGGQPHYPVLLGVE